MELRIGCPPASSCRLQNQSKRPAKASMQPMLLPVRSIIVRKTTGIPAMRARKVRGAHAHCGCYVGAAPACDLPLSGRYTAAQSLAVSAAVMLLCRKKRKNPASRRASGCHAACKKGRQAARHPFADCSTQRYTAAVMPLAGKNASVPPASLKNVSASLQSPLRFQPWRKAQQQHIPGGRCKS